MPMTDHPPSQTNSCASWRDVWMNLPDVDKVRALQSLHPLWREQLSKLWSEFALPHQRPPELAQGGAPWTTWLILGGRGAGKTRAGAEWVRGEARNANARIALVGETKRDAREVMVEGLAGLLGLHENYERPDWISSRARLEWPSGAIAECFSADDPDQLRGPQFSAAWC